MPVTNYYSVGGELLGEETGGVRRDYLTDALGSVTGTVTSAGAIENTYRYTPYGAQLSKTGSAADPAFTWIGKWGYRQTAKTYSDVYVRARHYSSTSSNWTSFDKLVETKNKYNYAECSPLQLIDYDGKLAMRATTAPEAGASAIVGAGCNSAYFVTQYLNPMLIEHGFAVQHVIHRFRGFDGRNKFMSELPNLDAWESFKIEGGKYEEDKDIFNVIWTRGRVRTRGCFRVIGFTKFAAQSPEFMHKNNFQMNCPFISPPCTFNKPNFPYTWNDFETIMKYLYYKWDCEDGTLKFCLHASISGVFSTTMERPYGQCGKVIKGCESF